MSHGAPKTLRRVFISDLHTVRLFDELVNANSPGVKFERYEDITP